jgi:dTMP kinase
VSDDGATPRSGGGGRFITFEGIEGTGKTTQIDRLARTLRGGGTEVVVTREPGGTALGRELRTLLLQPSPEPMSPLAELLLYVADRAQHLTELVEPALARGAIVLCDRYKEATLAYQGYGRALGVERVHDLHRHAPLDRVPDRTIVLELDPVESVARAARRNEEHNLTAIEGRFEQERLEFHRRVLEGYRALAAAEPDRIRIVDARGDVDRVERRVLDAVRDLLPVRGKDRC